MQSNRTLVTIVLAVVLMVLVMAVAAMITFGGMANREKIEAEVIWSAPAQSASSMNITDLTGDKQRDIFVQDTAGIKLLNEQGQVTLDKPFPGPLATTMGDVNNDGVPDIIAAYWGRAQTQVIAFTGQDQQLWQVGLAELDQPSRITAIDFDNDRRSEVVVGDNNGHLTALSAQGETLWQYTLPDASTLRGLDDVALSEGRAIAAGIESGPVVILNRRGAAMWQTSAAGGLRRLRSFPLGGPQNGRVFVGSQNGELTVYEGASGQPVWNASLGQAINEVRPAEVDGDPATTEVIVGGKDGGVWAFDQSGQQVWSARVGDKVAEIVGVDSDGSGWDEVIIGDESGAVNIFSAGGSRLADFTVQGPVTRLDSGKLAGTQEFLVADSNEVKAYRLAKTTAPFWYSPLLGGLLACLVIAGVAYFLASLKPAPTVQVSAEQMTVEAQRARRRMLHESIQDLKKMQGHNEVSGEAYLARLKELRMQLADVNATLIKLGDPIKVETFSCPHCGGSLELGSDRCEFCGHVVIV
jgi:outer membrane protein assembly factor BamB